MLEHSGESLLWTRWFVHSNIGRRPVCIWLMRRRFRSREGPTHREPFRPVRADSLAQGVNPLPPPWSEPRRTNRATLHCPTLDPTTSFLTAAALIYAIGAGITAGAGTRLVHQWSSPTGLDIVHCNLHDTEYQKLLFLFAASAVLLLGNLRACCHP